MIILEHISARPVGGTLIYRQDEYALATEPNQGAFTSLLVNDVHIELDEEGCALSVWGLCPHPSWIPRTLSPPSARKHRLRVTGANLVPGVGIRLNPGHYWSVFVDYTCGWLCLGDPDPLAGDAYQFAPEAVAVLKGGHLVALWLQPVQLPVLVHPESDSVLIR